MSTNQRKKKLNKPKLQLRMIGVFLAISGFAAFGQALLLSQSLMDVGLSIQDPKVAREVQDAMPGILSQNLLWTTLLLLPFILMVGIHVTHRIAGPAYRIERYLRAVVESGEANESCRVRDTDELKNLAHSINRAFDRLRKTSTQNQTTQTSVQ